MLSGEILSRTPLSVAILPPPSLIQLCKAMAAIATLANQQNIDDDDIYLGNLIIFFFELFSNKNYKCFLNYDFEYPPKKVFIFFYSLLLLYLDF